MSDEVLDDVMIKGSCKGKADAIVNCQCNIESAPVRCEQAERCMDRDMDERLAQFDEKMQKTMNNLSEEFGQDWCWKS